MCFLQKIWRSNRIEIELIIPSFILLIRPCRVSSSFSDQSGRAFERILSGTEENDSLEYLKTSLETVLFEIFKLCGSTRARMIRVMRSVRCTLVVSAGIEIGSSGFPAAACVIQSRIFRPPLDNTIFSPMFSRAKSLDRSACVDPGIRVTRRPALTV